MIFKDVEYRSDNEQVRQLSDLLYIAYNPALTIPGSVILTYVNPELLLLFGLHLLHLGLYKGIPMVYFGANSEMDISNHVSSVLFFIAALGYTGVLTPLIAGVVFTFVGVTAIASVWVRSQHTIPGAVLGAVSIMLIYGAALADMAPLAMVTSVTVVEGLLYLLVMWLPQSEYGKR